ncbi:MAG: BlaI/MecI/CopY family transcriptional regulator [Verrucomicrobiaceae bacterium]|nr:BlaI/MecI/CopY family transcriptional regulator [Verrucomicrobiaceae bacterium]
MPEKMHQLSRREREIMDIIYAKGEISAAEVGAEMEDAPSYSAIRTHLRILVEKGHLKHRQDGPRYLYAPVRSHAKASHSMLRKVLDTFFEGSLANAVAAMADGRDGKIDDAEMARLEDVLRNAKSKRSK